ITREQCCTGTPSETKTSSASKTCCPDGQDSRVSPPGTTACSSTPSCGSPRPARRGATCPNAWATGTRSGNASADGRTRASGPSSSGNSRTRIWSGWCWTAPSSAPTPTPPALKKSRRHGRAGRAGFGQEPGRLGHQDPRGGQRADAAGDGPPQRRPGGGRQPRQAVAGSGPRRGAGGGGDSGQGLRQQGGGRDGQGHGRLCGDPDALDAQRAARDRQGPVQGAQPGRTLLAQGEGLPPRGDALREDRHE